MSNSSNDVEVLRQYSQFIRDDDADNIDMESKWEVVMARNYYDQLYKEFAIVDFSRIKQSGLVGLRWRSESEVLSGKAEFSCGSSLCSVDGINMLKSYEVPFQYSEENIVKTELVKVKLCSDCFKKMSKNIIKRMSKV